MAANDQLFTKSLSDFEIKDADRGEVSAVVSVFDVVDRDGDVVLSGAIKDGTTVKLSSYNHDVITEGKPPVGKGVIRIDGQRAILEGRYFMSTERGREAFASVKELGADSEWSIGYRKKVQTAPMTRDWAAKGARRVIAGLDAMESSPVFLGANQYTETLGVKSAEEPPAPIVDDAFVKAVAAEVANRMAAEQKAKEDEAAEVARVEAEAKAAAEAAALAEVKAAELAEAAREFTRFERTMRRFTCTQ
jgi:hypothetical protein